MSLAGAVGITEESDSFHKTNDKTGDTSQRGRWKLTVQYGTSGIFSMLSPTKKTFEKKRKEGKRRKKREKRKKEKKKEKIHSFYFVFDSDKATLSERLT